MRCSVKRIAFAAKPYGTCNKGGASTKEGSSIFPLLHYGTGPPPTSSTLASASEGALELDRPWERNPDMTYTGLSIAQPDRVARCSFFMPAIIGRDPFGMRDALEDEILGA